MVGTRSRKGTLRRPAPAKKRIIRRRTRPAWAGLVLIVLMAVVLTGGVLAAVERLPGFGPYALYVDDIAVGSAHAFAGHYHVFIRPLTAAAGIYTSWDPATGQVSIGGRQVPVDYVDGEAATDLAPIARQLGMGFRVDHWRREIRIYSGRPLLPAVPAGRAVQVYMDGALLSTRAVEAGGEVIAPLKLLAMALGADSGRGPDGGVVFEGKPIAAYNRAGVIEISVGEACARTGARLSLLGLGRYNIDTGAPIIGGGAPVPTSGGGPPAAVRTVAVAAKLVALTFDDDLVPDTAKLLDILEARKVPATFFVTGRSVIAQPGLARRIVSGGSELGNHTYDHTDLAQIDDVDQIRAEILGTRRAIFAATGTATELFRPPGGVLTTEAEKAIAGSGQKLIMWSVSVGDYLPGKRAADIVRGVVRGASPGGIILLHNAPAATIQALPSIIDQLRAKGYGFATVSELLATAKNQGGGGNK